jgi:hypothetical protein
LTAPPPPIGGYPLAVTMASKFVCITLRDTHSKLAIPTSAWTAMLNLMTARSNGQKRGCITPMFSACLSNYSTRMSRTSSAKRTPFALPGCITQCLTEKNTRQLNIHENSLWGCAAFPTRPMLPVSGLRQPLWKGHHGTQAGGGGVAGERATSAADH